MRSLLAKAILRTPVLALPRPDFEVDFANTKALDRLISFTRAGSATYIDAAGALQTAGNDVPRFQYEAGGRCLGLLIEHALTNYLFNSAAPANQTTPALATGTYCLWMVGAGTATISANTGTATGLGAASDGTPVVFTVTVAGTFNIVVAGGPTRFQLENWMFPTSFISTAGAAGTRAVDVAQINSTAFGNLWNTNEGTVIVDAQIAGRTLWVAAETIVPAGKGISILANSNRLDAVVSDGAFQESISFGDTGGAAPSFVLGSRRTAMSYSRQSLQISWAWDNVLVATRLARTFNLTETLFRFGHSQFLGGSNNGTIARVRYYRKALPLSVLTRISQSKTQLV